VGRADAGFHERDTSGLAELVHRVVAADGNRHLAHTEEPGRKQPQEVSRHESQPAGLDRQLAGALAEGGREAVGLPDEHPVGPDLMLGLGPRGTHLPTSGAWVPRTRPCTIAAKAGRAKDKNPLDQ